MLTKQQKIKQIEAGEKLLEKNKSLVFVDFSGVSVEDMNNLRRNLKQLGSQLKVIKKKLLRIILQNKKIDFDPEQFEVQLGTIFSEKDIKDISEIANPLYKFFKKYEKYFLLPKTEKNSEPCWFGFPLLYFSILFSIVDGKTIEYFNLAVTHVTERAVACPKIMGTLCVHQVRGPKLPNCHELLCDL